MKNKKPNIVLIVMDDVRQDHLSCYGYEKETTPNLNRISNQSVIYSNNISPSIWTLESTTSLMTGTYSCYHNTNWGNLHLDRNLTTLAEFLKSKGYQTTGISNNYGFVSWETGLARGFDQFFVVRGLFKTKKNSSYIKTFINRMISKLAQELQLCEYSSSFTNKTAKRHIQKIRRKKPPFFLYLHYSEPHFPRNPPRKFNKFVDSNKVNWLLKRKVNQDPVKYLSGQASLTKEDLETLKGLYDGEICYLDQKIGELYDFLKKQNILDDTIFIITSDHGELFGEHNLIEHRYCLYDPLLKVPLIVKYPQNNYQGKKVEKLTQTLDVFPTVAKMLSNNQSNVKKQFQGYSLLPEDLEKNSREFTISEYLVPQITQNISPKYALSRFDRSLRCIRTPKYKFIWSSDYKHEFYNLKKDPNENKNIIQRKKEIADKLKNKLLKWSKDNCDFKKMKLNKTLSANDLDKKMAKKLKDLGYL